MEPATIPNDSSNRARSRLLGFQHLEGDDRFANAATSDPDRLNFHTGDCSVPVGYKDGSFDMVFRAWLLNHLRLIARKWWKWWKSFAIPRSTCRAMNILMVCVVKYVPPVQHTSKSIEHTLDLIFLISGLGSFYFSFRTQCIEIQNFQTHAHVTI